jgi:hypothetical protein
MASHVLVRDLETVPDLRVSLVKTPKAKEIRNSQARF